MNLKKVLELSMWLEGKIKWHDSDEWNRLIGELLLEHLQEHGYGLK